LPDAKADANTEGKRLRADKVPQCSKRLFIAL